MSRGVYRRASRGDRPNPGRSGAATARSWRSASNNGRTSAAEAAALTLWISSAAAGAGGSACADTGLAS